MLGDRRRRWLTFPFFFSAIVNEVLGDHNVDKQMSDSRGDMAYLMADISNVKEGEIKDLYEQLEGLSSRIMTRVLY